MCGSMERIITRLTSTVMTKPRLEQDTEFRINFEPYAKSNCKVCHGTAKKVWREYLNGEYYGAYEICDCVLKNINKEKKQLVN